MELLKEIVELPCVSGFEKNANGKLVYFLSNLCDRVNTDALGNIFGFVNAAEQNAPTVMLCAHYDEIGLIVTEICEKGFVKFGTVGGVDERILPGAEVILHGMEDIYGIIGIRPPHILTPEEQKVPEAAETLVIDTGMSKEKLEEIIKIGTSVSFKKTFRKMQGSVSAGALDNRVGVYSLLRFAESVEREKMKANVVIMLSVSEELNRGGAKTGAYKINPDMTVVVDATFAKTPECDAYSANEFGGGPVICKGPSLNRFYTAQLVSVAEKKKIPYQVEVEGADTGTDAFVMETAREGIPCTLVSYPLKYMHTGIETADEGDIAKLITLLQEFVYGFSEVQYA